MELGGVPDSLVNTSTVELIADFDQCSVVFERESDVGEIGAIDEIDEFPNEWSGLVKVNGCRLERTIGGDFHEILDESAGAFILLVIIMQACSLPFLGEIPSINPKPYSISGYQNHLCMRAVVGCVPGLDSYG